MLDLFVLPHQRSTLETDSESLANLAVVRNHDLLALIGDLSEIDLADGTLRNVFKSEGGRARRTPRACDIDGVHINKSIFDEPCVGPAVRGIIDKTFAVRLLGNHRIDTQHGSFLSDIRPLRGAAGRAAGQVLRL